MSSNPRAAARVFDIAELFEHIALFCAYDAIATNIESEHLEPLETLSRLRRINHSTNNGILSSRALQSLSPVTASAPTKTVHGRTRLGNPYTLDKIILTGIEWLLYHKLRLPMSHDIDSSGDGITDVLRIELRSVIMESARPLVDEFKAKKNDSAASWRNVPVRGDHNLSKVWMTCRYLRLAGRLYTEVKGFGGDVTLGEVADYVFEVVGMSVEDHERVRKEKETKYKGTGRRYANFGGAYIFMP